MLLANIVKNVPGLTSIMRLLFSKTHFFTVCVVLKAHHLPVA